MRQTRATSLTQFFSALCSQTGEASTTDMIWLLRLAVMKTSSFDHTWTVYSSCCSPPPVPPPLSNSEHLSCRGAYNDYHPSQSYSSRRHSPGHQPSSCQAPLYGDRGSRDRDRDRDAPRGHMRSRREMDSRDHHSRTDREPKRRRSDPMGDDDVNGHHPARDDMEFRYVTCLKLGSIVCLVKQ